MPAVTGKTTPPAPPPGDIVLRALMLVVIITAAGAWAWYHMGWPLRFPAVFAGLTAAVGGAVKIVDWLLGKKVLETAREHMRAGLSRALTWRVVLAPAAVLLVSGAFVSSIAVIPETPGEASEVRVAPSGDGGRPAERELDRDHPVARFPVLTLPWGRSYDVEADGYARGTFRTYPIVTRRIRLARDLPRVPAVLFRPGADGTSLLGDGAVFSVWHVTADGRRELIAADSSGRQTSFLIGRRQAIDDALVARWRDDLGQRETPRAVDAIIRAWRDPLQLQPLRGIPTGGTLVAEIVLGTTLVSRAEVRLTPERLVDVPMTDVLLDTRGSP